MQMSVVSFGYKHGLPLDVDLVFDCRFLPEPALGRRAAAAHRPDDAVRDYVLAQPEAMLPRGARPALRPRCCPGSCAKGSRTSDRLGCTGGRHRTVVIAEELAQLFRRHDLEPSGRAP